MRNQLDDFATGPGAEMSAKLGTLLKTSERKLESAVAERPFLFFFGAIAVGAAIAYWMREEARHA